MRLAVPFCAVRRRGRVRGYVLVGQASKTYLVQTPVEATDNLKPLFYRFSAVFTHKAALILASLLRPGLNYISKTLIFNRCSHQNGLHIQAERSYANRVDYVVPLSRACSSRQNGNRALNLSRLRS